MESGRTDKEESKGLSKKHYEAISRWAKEIGLGSAGVLVAQQIIAGVSFGEPKLIAGLILTIAAYFLHTIG